MKHKKFIKNAVILTVTSLILRTVGIFFRIWMSGTIGAEGMGLYQLVLSVYVLFSTFAGAGICTAVTRIISELPEKSGKSARKTVRRAISLSVIIAIISGVILYVCADFISGNLICDLRAAKAIKILSLAFPFMGASSSIRGYFIAIRNTTAPSVSQLCEQAVRIAVIVYLVSVFAPYGLSYTCTAIVIGDAVAEALGCTVLYIRYRFSLKKEGTKKADSKRFPVTHKIIHIALPITAGRYIHTALRTVENLLVPQRLGTFSSNKSAGLEQFGMLKGMALPLLFFPASFLAAFSTLMIPEISEAMAKGHYSSVKTATEKSIGITVVAATAIAGIFTVSGNEIAMLLYNSKGTGILLCALAPLIPFMYLESVCDGILKGLDQQTHSFIYCVIDSITRIILIWFFVGDYGMAAFLIIMVYSNLLTSGLNIRRLLKVTGTKILFKKWVLYPLFSVAVGGTLGFLAKAQFSGNIGKIASASAVTVIVYLILMYFFGALTVIDDI